MTKESDSSPVSEGMLYGPVAPPALHETKSAQWVMDSVDGSLEGYQLNMLKDQLMLDKQEGIVTEETAEANLVRLDQAIARAAGLHWVPRVKAIRTSARKRKETAPESDLTEWLTATQLNVEALEDLAHLTFNVDEAVETLEAAKYAKTHHEYRRSAAELS